MGCMEMSHSALAIYYKAVQATPQIPLQFRYNEAKLGNLSRDIKKSAIPVLRLNAYTLSVYDEVGNETNFCFYCIYNAGCPICGYWRRYVAPRQASNVCP